jgi:ABC-type glycerol-3-phosphate transport system permease component
MAVRRGARANLIKALTYAVLCAVSIVILFPFAVAVMSSVKRAEDVQRFPPSLIPRAPVSRVVDGQAQPLFGLPGRSGTYAQVENGVDLATYKNPENAAQSITLKSSEGTATGRTVSVEGVDKELFDIVVDGKNVTWLRDRTATGALFENVSDPSDKVAGLVLEATRREKLGMKFSNYGDVLTKRGMKRALTNTLLVTALVVFGQVATSVASGYAFSRLRFRGRDALFLMYLGSVMVPFVVLIIPLYQLMVKIGWTNNLVALVVPFVFSAYGTFLMRQFFSDIPVELEEAALLDGASRFVILRRIFIPLARPAIATLCTFGFLYAWNSFVWPLVIMQSGDDSSLVLSLALSKLGGRGGDDPALLFTGVCIAMAPPIIVFLMAQRYFVENASTSGLK